MKAELRCADVRTELSARLDGETDEATARLIDVHLQACPACRRHEAALQRARLAVRLQPAGAVPDLSRDIMQRIRTEAERANRRAGDRRSEWAWRARIAGIAAVAAALLLVTSIPNDDRPLKVAGAAEIADEVRAAARTLEAYEATFEITERNWHQEVPSRRFSATLSFEAPERFALHLRDLTDYPGAPSSWPRNDVDVVANERRYWIKEPSLCPPAALPGCVAAPRKEERSLVSRTPFDGTSPLPTDIVAPLETLGSVRGFSVLGKATALGRSVYRIALPYRNALPLIDSLQAGGSWRGFHPQDRVEIWIDSQTWFPLRYRVTASSSGDRARWAELEGIEGDEPGEVLYEVRAVSFAEQGRLSTKLFRAPKRGIVRRGGFRPASFAAVSGWGSPSFTGGLAPYRAGVTGIGQRIETYAEGTTRLKVVTQSDPGRSLDPADTAEELKLEGDGYLYYEPATETLGRRIDILGRRTHVHLESNLARRELLEVARSVGVRGRRVPPVESAGGYEVRRVDPERSRWFTKRPGYLPAGYRARNALLSRSEGGVTLTTYYGAPEAEYEGFGARITQSSAVSRLAPTAEEGVFSFGLGGTRFRWSSERAELEWIDGGAATPVYRAVAVPSFDLSTALLIARGLR